MTEHKPSKAAARPVSRRAFVTGAAGMGVLGAGLVSRVDAASLFAPRSVVRSAATTHPAKTVHLAGTFRPTEELGALVVEANALTARLMKQTHKAKAVRADLDINDLPMLFEQMSAIRVQDAERTAQLRRRYVAVLLDALRPEATTGRLPGKPPSDAELGERWVVE